MGRATRVVGLGVGLAGLLAACGAAGRAPAGGLAGRVVDEQGAPLVGATVYVFAAGEDRLLGEERTDDDGGFALALEAPDAVDLRVGRFTEEGHDGVPECWWIRATEVLDVAPGGAPLRIVVEGAGRACTLPVLVTAEGRGVPRLDVRAVPTLFPRDGTWECPCGFTDDEGRVTLDDLPRLPVRVCVRREPPWCPARGPVRLPGSRGTEPVVVEVERARVLHGRVLDAAGEPVAACGVMVTSPRDTASRGWGDLTGVDGTYEVGVPASWPEATLLVGCDVPEETSAHRLATTVDPAADDGRVVRLAGGAGGPPASPATEETRRVMEAVIREHYVGASCRAVVVRSTLDSLHDLGDWLDPTTYLKDAVDETTVRDLERRTKEARCLPAGLEVGVPVVVLDGAWWRYLEETHHGGEWQHLDRRFPHGRGWLMLSPVGFSEDGRQAVLHVAHVRGYLNADGCYHLLERRFDRWIVVARRRTWIS